MIRDASDFEDKDSNFGDVQINPHMYQRGSQVFGPPVVHNHFHSDSGDRNSYKNHSSRKKRVIAAIIVVAGIAGYNKREIISSSIATYKDNRHERCMPSSAILNGVSFNVCFKPSKMYDRGDGSVGALATLKSINGDSAQTTPQATNPIGTSAVTIAEGPFFYDIESSLCSLGTDKGTAELDNARKFVIANSTDLTGKVKHIPSDPALIIITSEFKGQLPDQSPAIVTCP